MKLGHWLVSYSTGSDVYNCCLVGTLEWPMFSCLEFWTFLWLEFTQYELSLKSFRAGRQPVNIGIFVSKIATFKLMKVLYFPVRYFMIILHCVMILYCRLHSEYTWVIWISHLDLLVLVIQCFHPASTDIYVGFVLKLVFPPLWSLWSSPYTVK